jgi:chromosome segregation ATPase
MFKFVLIGLLVATAAAASAKHVLSQDMSQTLHDIAAQYGMSVGEATKLVFLSNPKSQILDELQALLTQLRSEQNEAEAQHQAFVDTKQAERDSLVGTVDSLDVQIKEAETHVVEVTSQIVKLKAQLDLKQTQADEADAQARLYEALLEKLAKEHADAVSRYSNVIKQHDDSLATLQTLIDMVSNLQFNEALSLLKRQRHSFLHRKSSRIGTLVKSTIELMQQEGPKNDIKDRLLQLLNKIKEGTVHSRQLYLEEAADEVTTYTGSSTNYASMVSSFNTQREEALAEIAELNGKIAQAESDQQGSQGSIDNNKDTQSLTQDAINALDAEVANENSKFSSETEDRLGDMNDVEAAIQYVNDNVQGMSLPDLCHIGAPGCYRCLSDSDCQNGKECSDEGQCVDKPNPVKIGGKVSENDTLNLSCPDDKTIVSIDFASYGMPSGSFPSYEIGWCHSPSSQIVVSNTCVGQKSCSVRAENDVFGDPCDGTFKKMDVVAVCE